MNSYENLQIIKHAIEKNESLVISYFGGSQPGTIRVICPTKLEGDTLWARYANDVNATIKQFKLRHIKIENNEARESYDFEKVKLSVELSSNAEFNSVLDVANTYKDEIISMGFHIEINDDFITIHSYFKNGKLKKGYEISMSYMEYEYLNVVQVIDGKLVEVLTPNKKRTKPYIVTSIPGASTRAFKHLDKAAEFFYQEIINLFTNNCNKG